MSKYSHAWLMVIGFSASAIAEKRPFIVKLQGNTLYSKSAVGKPVSQAKHIYINSNNSLTSEPTTKLVLAPYNKMEKDTSSSQKPVKAGYLTIQSHCLDRDSLNPLDSVVMDVYSNGEHITAGMSDKNGFISTDSIPPGNYFVVLYRKNYKTFSTFISRTSLNGQSYIDIPLKKNEKYLYESFGQRLWKYIVSFQGLLIFLLVCLFIKLSGVVIKYAI